MGAIASLDVLGIGTTVELSAQDGQRVTATGVEGGGLSSFFSSLNLIGIFPVLQFGAVGDGVTNDLPAFNAAMNAAKAFGVGAPNGGGTVWVHNPEVAFGITAPIVVPPGIRLIGQATQRGQCAIRALAPMNQLVFAADVVGETSTQPIYCDIEGLTLDGRSLALYGGVSSYGFLGVWRRVFVQHCLLAGFANPGLAVPVTLSAVTVSGGGVDGDLTLSLPDPTFSGYGESSSTNLMLEIVDPGGLQTATYHMSEDGGATFATAKQFVYSASNICRASLNAFLQASGVQGTWIPKNYVAGARYAFTVTVPPQSIGGTNVGAEQLYDDCEVFQVGTVYGTATTITSYTDLCANPVTLGGTVDVTNVFSDPGVVVGHGTTWLSGAVSPAMQPRPGQLLSVIGAGQQFGVACVLDDEHIAIARGGFRNSNNLVGVQWALSNGAALDTYGAPGDNVRIRWTRGHIDGAPIGMLCGGNATGALYEDQTRIENTGFAGVVVGNPSAQPLAALFLRTEVKPSGVTNEIAWYLYLGTSSTIIEPTQGITASAPVAGGSQYFGGQGSALVTIQANTYAVNGGLYSKVPIAALSLTPGAIILSAPTDTIPAPVVDGKSFTETSMTFALVTANITLTSATPITPPPVGLDGLVLIAVNTGTFTAVLPAAGNNLRQPADIAWAPNTAVAYVSRSNHWQFLFAGNLTLAGDTTGPAGANITTGLHHVVNWQSATLVDGSALAGGAAVAPPATPETYVQIVLNGTTLFIPAYHTGA